MPESSQEALAQIVQSAIQEANIQIVVSPSIVAEYRRVSRKFAQYGFPSQWLEFLIESALRFSDGESWQHPVPDPDDARFLSLAHKTGAWLTAGVALGAVKPIVHDLEARGFLVQRGQKH